MNVVFDIESLKVLSLIGMSLQSSDFSSDRLKLMFPLNKNVDVWHIDCNLPLTPVGLFVGVDANRNPISIVKNGKIVYKAKNNDLEKRKQEVAEKIEDRLTEVLPKGFFATFKNNISKTWMVSPYSSEKTKEELADLSYFTNNKIYLATWWGMFLNAGGYANMNRSFLFRLHNHHIITRAEEVAGINQISQRGQYYVQKHRMIKFNNLKRHPKIFGFGPSPQPPHKGKKVFYTMMETETLHPTFSSLCNEYSDEIWVPSIHNLNLFLKGGVKKPIHVMPLGIDERIYTGPFSNFGNIPNNVHLHDIMGKSAKEGLNSFHFITLFGWSYRKGTDILIKSFVKAFTDRDDVCLIICSNHVGPDKVREDARQYGKQIRTKNLPQIVFYGNVTSEEDMPSIYRMGHAFIHTSRGEGFSLPQVEASACGLPVISCNNTGMSQYLTDDNAYLIKTDKTEMCSKEMEWISSFYHNQLFPKLGKDQIDQAVSHMHNVVNDYKSARYKGEKLTRLVYKEYTWESVVNKVAKRIKEISN